MPRSQPARPRRWMRSLASLLASVLGLVAVCLVVFGTTQKQLQIGVLLGLWAGLIAAFLMVGPRRAQAEHAARLAEAEQRARELHEAQLQVSQMQQAQLAAAEEARGRNEVELRRLGELQASRESVSRREADLQLELSLRREIQRMMNEQIGLLRNEVAALRAEVVDKLGGQLRLERIETTRLIGSDLEALQHEIRRLAGQESIGAGAAQLAAGVSRISLDRNDVVEHQDLGRGEPLDVVQRSQRMELAERYDAERYDAERYEVVERYGVERSDAEDRPDAAEREAEAAGRRGDPAPERQAVPDPGRQPAWSEPTVVSFEVPTNAGTAEPPADPFDLFAGLPRLSPLPADIELIPDPPQREAGAAAGRRHAADQAPAGYPSAEQAEQVPAEPSRAEQVAAGHGERPPAGGYHGRRRATAEDAEEPAPAGGRRRAPDDAPDDLLARLRHS